MSSSSETCPFLSIQNVCSFFDCDTNVTKSMLTTEKHMSRKMHMWMENSVSCVGAKAFRSGASNCKTKQNICDIDIQYNGLWGLTKKRLCQTSSSWFHESPVKSWGSVANGMDFCVRVGFLHFEHFVSESKYLDHNPFGLLTLSINDLTASPLTHLTGSWTDLCQGWHND